MATIDVLLPVKNGMPFLRESIDSIRAQTFRDWKLLILDHGSTDGSIDLADRYSELDERIVLHRHPEADGLAGLLNIGLEKSDCRYVFRQDSDDISMPQRFQLTLDAFGREPDLLLVGSEAVEINTDGAATGYLKRPGSPSAVFVAYPFYSPVCHPSVGLNHAALARHRARYGRDFVNVLPEAHSIQVNAFAEDYFFFGQLALLGRQLNLKEPLIKYRVHGGSVSATKRQLQASRSIEVSRFLARAFCAMNELPLFDPAPFNASCGYVYDLGYPSYEEEFAKLELAMRRHCAPDAEFERELAYRRIFAYRDAGEMAARYAAFAVRFGIKRSEWLPVRNWLLRWVAKIDRKYIYRIDGGLIA